MGHLSCRLAGIATRAITGLRVSTVALSLVLMMPATATAQTATAVEYYYAAWDYYFVTAFADEIAVLDGGGFGANWKRTGETFIVATQAGAGNGETCRFFSTSFAPKSSHFYTPFAAECASVKTSADWQYEGLAFYLQPADPSGNCPAGATVLYRLYNNGMGGAPNHRYTTSPATVVHMHALGWVSEGNGVSSAFGCLPPATIVTGTAEGRWTGATNSGQPARVVILDNGTFYITYSDIPSALLAGVVQGTASAINGQLASADAVEYPISYDHGSSPSMAATVSGTYLPGRSLQLTIVSALGTRILTATYDAGSELPANPAAIEGAYNGFTAHTAGGFAAVFTVASGGSFSGSNEGCRFSGTITPHASGNIFDFTANSAAGPTGCIFGRGPIAGIAFYDAASRELHAYAPFSFRFDLWYVNATKK